MVGFFLSVLNQILFQNLSKTRLVERNEFHILRAKILQENMSSHLEKMDEKKAEKF